MHYHTHSHLQSGVGVELIQEVHEQVALEGAHTQDDVPLCLSPMSAVVPT